MYKLKFTEARRPGGCVQKTAQTSAERLRWSAEHNDIMILKNIV